MSRSRLKNTYMKDLYKDGKLSYYKATEKSSYKNKHRLDEMPKNKPSKYISSRCSNAEWLQEPSNFCGHKPHKNGHRMVSGIVRAKIKEEIRKNIEDEYNE